MFFLLFILILLSAIALAVVLPTKKPGAKIDSNPYRQIPPPFSGLFSDQFAYADKGKESEREGRERLRAELRARASEGDLNSLVHAHETQDERLYRDVLDVLVEGASSDADRLRELAGFLTEHGDLRSNIRLARRLLEVFRENPTAEFIVCLLHVTSMSHDAGTFQTAIETTVDPWRDGRLEGMSGERLWTLIESEYWLLPSEARQSGDGFLLKRAMSNLRRQLSSAPPRS